MYLTPPRKEAASREGADSNAPGQKVDFWSKDWVRVMPDLPGL